MYPIGIPALYATTLWKNRELLNPGIHSITDSTTVPSDGADEAATRAFYDPARADDDIPPAILGKPPRKGQTKKRYSLQEMQELEAKVEARREHPKLAPSMFLWKDFGEACY